MVQKDQNKLLEFLNSIGLEINALSLEEISLHLRELTVQEWLGEIVHTMKIFLQLRLILMTLQNPRYFQNDLGDTMILAMSNVLCLPIIVFSTIDPRATCNSSSAQKSEI